MGDCKWAPAGHFDFAGSLFGDREPVVVSGSQIRGGVSPEGGHDSPGAAGPEWSMSAGQHG
jgi:hypothetical protein